jgi:hypothetical protein
MLLKRRMGTPTFAYRERGSGSQSFHPEAIGTLKLAAILATRPARAFCSCSTERIPRILPASRAGIEIYPPNRTQISGLSFLMTRFAWKKLASSSANLLSLRVPDTPEGEPEALKTNGSILKAL